jgi:hypothetical protein
MAVSGATKKSGGRKGPRLLEKYQAGKGKKGRER